MTATQTIARPFTQPVKGHTGLTYCNVACPRCDQLMTEKSIQLKAAEFALNFGKPGSRGFIEARNRIIAAALTRLDMATAASQPTFEANADFNRKFDAGNVTWVNDVAVRS